MISRLLGITAILSLAAFSEPLHAVVTDFDDIEFWIGQGTNRSAFVIQWNDGENPASLVWGYLWDDADAPTVQTMMFDIAGHSTLNPTGEVPDPVQPPDGVDSRLSLVGDAYSWGNFFTGISYNQVGLDGGNFSQTVRDRSGIGPGGESWTFYALGIGSAWPTGEVLPAIVGVAAFSLENGGWYGWSYTAAYLPPDFDPVPFSFTAPVAAVPEPSPWLLLSGGAIIFFLRKRHVKANGI